MEQSVRVAVIQDSSIIFDRDATIDKIEKLSKQAAEKKAELVLFPEAFIPATHVVFILVPKLGVEKMKEKLISKSIQIIQFLFQVHL